MASIRFGVRTAVLCVTFALAVAPSAAAVEDNEHPVLSNFSAVPNSLGWEGGTVTITVDATDDVGVTSVGATVHFANGGSEGVTLTATDSGAPDTYSGTLDVPPNHTTEPVGHSVEVSATDTDGETTLELMGWIDVDGQPAFDQAPYVSNATLDPTSLPSDGGTVTIGATATDDRSISEVYATVTDAVGGETYVPLDPISSDRFQSTWTAPANLGAEPQVYSVTVTALDDIGQPGDASAGQVSVQGVDDPGGGEDTAPLIISTSLDPTTLPSDGGAVTITTGAIDDSGIVMAYADVFVSGGDLYSVQLIPSDTDTYSGSINLPPNTTADDVLWGVTITVTDSNGGTDVEPAGVITVAGAEDPPPANIPPTIVTASVSPSNLGSDGGIVDIAVEAHDDRGIVAAFAQVVGDDATRTGLTTSDGESFTGSLSLPPNDTTEPVTYHIRIDIADADGATDTAGAGQVTVGAAPPSVGVLKVSQRKLTFGPQARGATSVRRFTLTNTGTHAPIAGALVLKSRRFVLTEPRGATFNLGPGETRQVTVRYTSSQPGHHHRWIRVSRDDDAQSRLRVRLTGRTERRG